MRPKTENPFDELKREGQGSEAPCLLRLKKHGLPVSKFLMQEIGLKTKKKSIFLYLNSCFLAFPMKGISFCFCFFFLLSFFCCNAQETNPSPGPLESGFLSPPDSAKPRTWWHWMNGNITKSGITADLEAMKSIGLGGATIINADAGIPDGEIPFMSPAWREAFQWAVSEGNRLGIELSVGNCAGWSSSGGPWISPEEGMQQVTWSEQWVDGPSKFSSPLPQPPTNLRCYREIAVLAFPAPTEKPMNIRDVEVKSGKKLEREIKQESKKEGKSSPISSDASNGSVLHRSEAIDLTAKLDPQGKLNWEVPSGRWIIFRFGYTPTGKNNHPAPAQGKGLECDKLSKAALDTHWNGFMQKMINEVRPLGGKGLRASLIDSYEVGGQNWTPHFREEFLKRRGYDLLTFLPTFTGRVVEDSVLSDRFLWDIRRTIADLFAENYYGHFTELCHQNGLLSEAEPYSGPFESTQCGSSIDLVMGEFWSGRKGNTSTKLASSIAHLYGKTLVGAEAFTAHPRDGGRWREDPYALKMLGDSIFCQGVNRYVFHRYAMQPWMNRSPGMTMGQWGFHFERTETWWKQCKSWIDYISRCQFLLQQGRFVADVAYFTGEGAPATVSENDPKLPSGYDYDIINAEVLLHGATVEKGRLTLPSGARYAALILPKTETEMTPALLTRLAELVKAGATVIGPSPQRSPGLTDYPKADQQIKMLSEELWGKCDGKSVLQNSYGQGQVLWNQSLEDFFKSQSLPPDFNFTSTGEETEVEYCHRVSGDTDLYFISNQQQKPITIEGIFRVSGKSPELWHADTGVIERAPIWHEEKGVTTVRLRLDPAGSLFVIFRKTTSPDHVVSAKMNPGWQVQQNPEGKIFVKATNNGTANLHTAAGKTFQATATKMLAPQEISGPWKLNFPPNWGAPASVTLDSLISWTHHPESGVRYFSGTATYEKTIEIAADRLLAGRELWLDLGWVKNLAEVIFNGQNLGVLWKPPFCVNLTAAAKPGLNQLQIQVTNLWPNRLIGDEQLPPDCQWKGQQLLEWPKWFLEGKPSPTGRLTFTTWHHWSKDDALLESGLLGPVTLQTIEIIPAIESSP